ncbi:MAG: histone deacetylase [Candidatus Thermoplasmatota archaeon]
MKGLTYHKDYNKYDLGIDHPLVGDKPARTIETFKEKKILKYFDVFTPKKGDERYILKVHDEKYIKKLKRLSKKGGELSADTPAPKKIYRYAALAAGGTILCGEKLLENYEIMMNPLGGFHHAGRSFSSGFCFLNDIAICIEYLKEISDLEKFLIVDLDVHHGNGTQDIYRKDSGVLNVSFHQDGRTIYPQSGEIEEIGSDKGEGYTINLPLPPGTGSGTFLRAFDSIVEPLTIQYKPDIILYQAGVDTHHSDPLADLELSYQTFYFLAKKMKDLSNKTCNKLLVMLGGGYDSLSCVNSYYNLSCGLLNSDNYIRETSRSTFQKFSEVMKRTKNLKKNLSKYWNLE